MIRTGMGFDIHPLAPNRRLVMGGVEIPHPVGLDGHSDADVLCHAVMDALLGAVADGDIGQHFPNTDARWKDARSTELLRHVAGRVRSLGATIINVDATVIAERPKLLPHMPAMRAALAAAMDVELDAVSIKATTAEKLGTLGRQEGIAAMTMATVDWQKKTGGK